jgi:hypothetical protein
MLSSKQSLRVGHVARKNINSLFVDTTPCPWNPSPAMNISNILCLLKAGK